MNKKTKALIYDLDGTLCSQRKETESYKDIRPIQSMIDQLNKFYDDGYEIIINTARNMATQNNDVGKVIQNVGEITLRWLREHNVKYHSINFGKPYGLIYIDNCSCLNDENEIERRLKTIENKTEKKYIEQQLKLLNKKEELFDLIKSLNDDENNKKIKEIINFIEKD